MDVSYSCEAIGFSSSAACAASVNAVDADVDDYSNRDNVWSWWHTTHRDGAHHPAARERLKLRTGLDRLLHSVTPAWMVAIVPLGLLLRLATEPSVGRASASHLGMRFKDEELESAFTKWYYFGQSNAYAWLFALVAWIQISRMCIWLFIADAGYSSSNFISLDLAIVAIGVVGVGFWLFLQSRSRITEPRATQGARFGSRSATLHKLNPAVVWEIFLCVVILVAAAVELSAHSFSVWSCPSLRNVQPNITSTNHTSVSLPAFEIARGILCPGGFDRQASILVLASGVPIRVRVVVFVFAVLFVAGLIDVIVAPSRSTMAAAADIATLVIIGLICSGLALYAEWRARRMFSQLTHYMRNTILNRVQSRTYRHMVDDAFPTSHRFISAVFLAETSSTLDPTTTSSRRAHNGYDEPRSLRAIAATHVDHRKMAHVGRDLLPTERGAVAVVIIAELCSGDTQRRPSSSARGGVPQPPGVVGLSGWDDDSMYLSRSISALRRGVAIADRLCRSFQLTKLGVVGDRWVAVGGLPPRSRSSIHAAADVIRNYDGLLPTGRSEDIDDVAADASHAAPRGTIELDNSADGSSFDSEGYGFAVGDEPDRENHMEPEASSAESEIASLFCIELSREIHALNDSFFPSSGNSQQWLRDGENESARLLTKIVAHTGGTLTGFISGVRDSFGYDAMGSTLETASIVCNAVPFSDRAYITDAVRDALTDPFRAALSIELATPVAMAPEIDAVGAVNSSIPSSGTDEPSPRMTWPARVVDPSANDAPRDKPFGGGQSSSCRMITLWTVDVHGGQPNAAPTVAASEKDFQERLSPAVNVLLNHLLSIAECEANLQPTSSRHGATCLPLVPVLCGRHLPTWRGEDDDRRAIVVDSQEAIEENATPKEVAASPAMHSSGHNIVLCSDHPHDAEVVDAMASQEILRASRVARPACGPNGVVASFLSCRREGPFNDSRASERFLAWSREEHKSLTNIALGGTATVTLWLGILCLLSGSAVPMVVGSFVLFFTTAALLGVLMGAQFFAQDTSNDDDNDDDDDDDEASAVHYSDSRDGSGADDHATVPNRSRGAFRAALKWILGVKDTHHLSQHVRAVFAYYFLFVVVVGVIAFSTAFADGSFMVTAYVPALYNFTRLFTLITVYMDSRFMVQFVVSVAGQFVAGPAILGAFAPSFHANVSARDQSAVWWVAALTSVLHLGVETGMIMTARAHHKLDEFALLHGHEQLQGVAPPSDTALDRAKSALLRVMPVTLASLIKSNIWSNNVSFETIAPSATSRVMRSLLLQHTMGRDSEAPIASPLAAEHRASPLPTSNENNVGVKDDPEQQQVDPFLNPVVRSPSFMQFLKRPPPTLVVPVVTIPIVWKAIVVCFHVGPCGDPRDTEPSIATLVLAARKFVETSVRAAGAQLYDGSVQQDPSLQPPDRADEEQRQNILARCYFVQATGSKVIAAFRMLDDSLESQSNIALLIIGSVLQIIKSVSHRQHLLRIAPGAVRSGNHPTRERPSRSPAFRAQSERPVEQATRIVAGMTIGPLALLGVGSLRTQLSVAGPAVAGLLAAIYDVTPQTVAISHSLRAHITSTGVPPQNALYAVHLDHIFAPGPRRGRSSSMHRPLHLSASSSGRSTQDSHGSHHGGHRLSTSDSSSERNAAPLQRSARAEHRGHDCEIELGLSALLSSNV